MLVRIFLVANELVYWYDTAHEDRCKDKPPGLGMKRICIINIAGLSRRLTAGRDDLWVSSLSAPSGGAMAPTLPAVASSVQASMTTGCRPGKHGIIAGGVFRRQSGSLSLADRSNTLLNTKRFWHARALPEAPKVALVFWSNPLAGGGDIVLGTAAYACQCGKVSHQPMGLYDRLAETCGQFDCGLISGPTASWRGAEWIANASDEIWRSDEPDLMWVNLPGIDFELIRGGVIDNCASLEQALVDVDNRARGLADSVRDGGGQVVVVSDGGYVDVSQAIRPNVALRDAGLLIVGESPDGPVVDIEASRAVALADHQVAHLYCRGERAADEAAEVLSGLEGIDSIAPRSELFCPGLGHDRAGERVATARPKAWFSPRAGSAGKLGFDPCELISNGGANCSADESLVRASRGRADVSLDDSCFLAATDPLETPREMCVTDLPDVLKKVMFE